MRLLLAALVVASLPPALALAADAASPQPNAASPSSAAAPDWARPGDPGVAPPSCPTPMPNDYPDKAQATNTPGSAVIGCTVAEGGRMAHCTVVSEEPPGMGFGAAALKMACLFRVHPKARDGRSALGAHIDIPIRFQLAAAPGSYAVSSDVQAAMSLFDRKDYQGALALIEKRLKAQPSDPVALATRGNIYIELGDYDDALKDHDAVLALVGDDQGALVNACWVRTLADEDLDRARAYCDRAEGLAIGTSQLLRAYDTRGFLDLRQGKFEAAIVDFDKALEARPRTASPLYGRGLAKTGLGKLDEGRTDIVAATKVQHDIAEQYARFRLTPPTDATAAAAMAPARPADWTQSGR